MFRLLLTLIFLSVIQVIAVPFIFSTGKSYAYDNRGYQTSRNGETLTYDVDGHLQSISVQGQEKVSYAYDALGRRIKKSSYDDAGNLKESRVFIRNGDRLCEEYKSTDDVSYSVDRRYVYGSYVDELIYAIRGNRQELYYHSDRQYNVRAISDYNRRPVEYYHYTPYGERTIHSRWAGKNRASSAYGQNFGFTGRYHDIESDLYYFRARYYDAEQGRFISRDPAGYIDGSGLYNGYFAWGFAMDPTGEFANVALGVVDAVDTANTVRKYFKSSDPCEKKRLLKEVGTKALATVGSALGVGVVVKGAKFLGKGFKKLKQLFKRTKKSTKAPKNGDKWSRDPKSIQDQMTLDTAKNGSGEKIIDNLGDPKYKGMEKWEYKVKSADGKDSVVHYVKDPQTGNTMDFKFKKHSTEGSGNWANTPEPKVPPGGN